MLGRGDSDEQSGTAHHSHTNASCSASSEASLSEKEEPFASSAPCKVGVMESSFLTEVLESEEQRNTQKVISLIRRESGLKVPKPESSSTLTISGVGELWPGSY